MTKNTTKPQFLSTMKFITIALEDSKVREVLNKLLPEFEEIYIARMKRKIEGVVLTLKFLIKIEATIYYKNRHTKDDRNAV